MTHLAWDRGSWIERRVFRRTLAWWAAQADAAEETGFSRLNVLHGRALALRGHLDRLIARNDLRLRPPPAIARPLGTEWSWRPGIFTEACGGVLSSADRSAICRNMTLFHDCALQELGVSQIRNRAPGAATPFAVRLEVFAFQGSFLSLVVDLPPEAVQGLRRKHVILVSVRHGSERPGRILVRLNVRHGPNAEQIVAEMDEEGTVEFDLVYSRMNEARVEKMWLDLLFETPEMNSIVLQDLTVIRRPRAEM